MNKKRQTASRASRLLAFVLSFSVPTLLPTIALADATTTALNTNFNPATFNGTGAGLTASVNQCFAGGPIAQAASQIQAAKAANKGQSGGACGLDTDPFTKTPQCSDFISNGNFDTTSSDSLYKKDLDLLNTSSKSLDCETRNLNGVQSTLTCLQQQGTALAQQMASLKSVYQSNLTGTPQGQQCVQSCTARPGAAGTAPSYQGCLQACPFSGFTYGVQGYKAREGDREAQMAFVNTTLGGNAGTGKQGLIALRDQTNQMVQQMNDIIRGLTATAEKITQQQKTISEQVSQLGLGVMNQCFLNQPNPQYHCPNNNSPVSASAYVLCMYSQEQNAAGNNPGNAIIGRSGQVATGDIQTIFNLILQNSPTSTVFPTTVDQSVANFSNLFTAINMTQINSMYVSQLPTTVLIPPMNGYPAQTVQGFVSAALNACYAQAQTVVQNAEGEASSGIGAAEFALSTAIENNQTAFTKALTDASNQWNSDMGGLLPAATQGNLPGNYPPMNISQNCVGGTPTVEENCLTNIQSQLSAMLNGGTYTSTNGVTTQAQTFIPPVPSKYPDTMIPPADLQCQGLNACVQKLQTVSTTLQTQDEALKDQQKAYVTQAVQTTQNFTTQQVQLLNYQSTQLLAQENSMNNTLRSLGGTGNIRFPPVTAEPQDFDQDGLPKVPNNMMNFLGSQTTPPMLDLTSGDTDYSEIQSLKEKIDGKTQKITQEKNNLTGLASQCQNQANVQLVTGAISQFTGQCGPGGNNIQACSAGTGGAPGLIDTNALNSLANSLSSAALSMGTQVSEVAQTSSSTLGGWVTTCTPTVSLQATVDKAIGDVSTYCKCSFDGKDATGCLQNAPANLATTCSLDVQTWQTASAKLTTVQTMSGACINAYTALLKDGTKIGSGAADPISGTIPGTDQ